MGAARSSAAVLGTVLGPLSVRRDGASRGYGLAPVDGKRGQRALLSTTTNGNSVDVSVGKAANETLGLGQGQEGSKQEVIAQDATKYENIYNDAVAAIAKKERQMAVAESVLDGKNVDIVKWLKRDDVEAEFRAGKKTMRAIEHWRTAQAELAELKVARDQASVRGGAWQGSSAGAGSSSWIQSVSAYATRGPRYEMEDEHYISKDERFFSVFDGHGGSEVSKYAQSHLYTAFTQRLASLREASDSSTDVTAAGGEPDADKDVDAGVDADVDADADVDSGTGGGEAAAGVALREAFADVSSAILDTNCNSTGSTAVVVYVEQDVLWAANLGDSRAVLSRDGEALDMTTDHKPELESEKARIEALGGKIWCSFGVCRVEYLNMSRAFGNRAIVPLVSDKPDVEGIQREVESDSFIILASDGLWNVMSSQEAVRFVQPILTGSIGELGQGGETSTLETQPQNIAKCLVDEAIRLGTTDNVTVLVVLLK